MIRKSGLAVLLALLTLTGAPGFAGDRSGDGYGGWKRELLADGEWKETYDDGNCKIERKRGKDGSFQQMIDCKRVPAPRPSAIYVPRQ